ncbi:MAG: hypothetical protein IAC51_02095 [bacterium]|uniref:Long-chain fatty acid transport protein n=1 Tax=Candidatus Aphodosoma intestinipullorum TaxID=2840674 RepID=A0A940DIS8_9BACT|nr:hypothetical protein [Candidatus Aphodosoma intestinipullorum]
MNKVQNLIILVLTVVISMTAAGIAAQNNTNSPYTRYGYGQLQDQGFSVSQSMGGISYGLRSNATINPGNPASYSAIDSTSFLFEFSASGLLSSFSSGGATRNTFTGNLDYIALQVPVTKWMGLSAGVIPFSFVGYNYNFNDSVKNAGGETDHGYTGYTQAFNGKGGISQVYLGLAFDLFDHLSLGANAYYMFGDITHYRTLAFESTDILANSTVSTSELYISSFNARFGLQYHETVGDKHAFTIGAVYEFKSPLGGKLTESTSGVDTVTTSSVESFELPDTYGGGFTYTYDGRFTIGADATYQAFSSAKYYGVTDSLSNRLKLSLGAEYVNDPRGHRYVDRMHWRLGASYSDSYVRVNGATAKDFAVTLGIGLPLRNSKTMINFDLKYGNIGGANQALLNEQYVQLGINVALNETWFVRSKVR